MRTFPRPNEVGCGYLLRETVSPQSLGSEVLTERSTKLDGPVLKSSSPKAFSRICDCCPLISDICKYQ